MPLFSFQCKKCEHNYEELCPHDPTGKYKGVRCPACKSLKKTRLVTAATAAFVNPIGTSKFDNFDYQAQWRMNRAQGESRYARAKSHMGPDPYNQIDDISSGNNFGEVK